MKKILFIADPNSIHDLKWITWFSLKQEQYTCFLICRKSHYKQLLSKIGHNQRLGDIRILDYIEEFSISNVLLTIKQCFKIRDLIIKNNIDLIHVLYAEPNALWASFQILFQRPIIITTRGTDILIDIPKFFVSGSMTHRILKLFYLKAFSNATFITCTSQDQINSIKNIIGRTRNVYLIRTGVNLHNIFEDTTDYLPEVLVGKKIIFFPRMMRPLYNHELCLNAIELLDDDIKQQYAFVFLNKDAEDIAYVKKIENQMLSLKDCNIVFLNTLSQPQIFEVTKKSSLVVMTPISDGTPNSAIEAMAVGVPVILPPLKYDNVIFNHSTATFLSAWDPLELKEKITYCLNTDLNDKLIMAKQVIVDNLSQEIQMGKLNNIYLNMT